jgi:tRNA threonylcarbamoyladenosine biosynthesis protein TsaE
MNGVVLDEAGLAAAGERLGQALPAGSVVWLQGELGAGKTTLVRAIVRGRGIREPASSPTYALVHHYEGPRGAVYHVDGYRLRHPDEAADLDWATLEEADLLLIEWPERAGAWAPPPDRIVRLSHVDERQRALEEVA